MRQKGPCWMLRLYGRIFEPSTQPRFADWWTSSLAVTPASPSLTQAIAEEKTTLDTFGHLLEIQSRQLNLFSSSLKTSMDISASDSTLFSKTFELWASLLKQDSLQRQRSAHPTDVNGSSSLHATPNTGDGTRGSRSGPDGKRGRLLSDKWPTPTISGNNNRPALGTASGTGLTTALKTTAWPTPQSRDGKGSRTLPETQQKNSRPLNEVVLHEPRHWPTPMAGDGRGGTRRGPGQAALGHMPALLPGPTSGGTDGLPPTEPSNTPLSLPDLWATPTAHPRASRPRQVDHGQQLANQVAQKTTMAEPWPAPTASSGTGPSNQPQRQGAPNLQSKLKGLLNPRWEEMLMGLPVGWLMPSCAEPMTAASMNAHSPERA